MQDCISLPRQLFIHTHFPPPPLHCPAPLYPLFRRDNNSSASASIHLRRLPFLKPFREVLRRHATRTIIEIRFSPRNDFFRAQGAYPLFIPYELWRVIVSRMREGGGWASWA